MTEHPDKGTRLDPMSQPEYRPTPHTPPRELARGGAHTDLGICCVEIAPVREILTSWRVIGGVVAAASGSVSLSFAELSNLIAVTTSILSMLGGILSVASKMREMGRWT